jgi:hypothetical protein
MRCPGRAVDRATAISRKLEPAKQAAFIRSYEALLNQLPADEAVMFADAVHPTHAVRAAGCWAPKNIPVAITQSSGRGRLNIHGAIDLETGNTRMLEVLVVNAASIIMLLMAIEAMYPGKRLIHVFLDNARYHAKLAQQWLARPGRRIRLHFIPSYCPHLDPIERLWGLMHRHCTHDKCYAGFKDFTRAVLTFLREKVPRNWHIYCHRRLPRHRSRSRELGITISRSCQPTRRSRSLPTHQGVLDSRACPSATERKPGLNHFEG